MKTPSTQKAAVYVVAALLVACPFASSTAVPFSQSVFVAHPSQVPVKKAENPVLVRNTGVKSSENAAKTDRSVSTPGPTAPESTKKVQDKKAMGRCWQRLMNMVREVNHVHRAKRKANQ